MRGDVTTMPESRLILDSRLDELARFWPWVEALAAEYAIPADTKFAIDLCLEEALSNIVRHGYSGEAGRPIFVDFTNAADRWTFTIEDHGPPFNPLELEDDKLAPTTFDELKAGGRGINLLRQFAGSLDYERIADGNRLTIRFAKSQS